MRRYVLTLVALLGAVAAVGALAVFKQPTLGLDLQGGLAIVLQAEAPKGESVDSQGMDRSLEMARLIGMKDLALVEQSYVSSFKPVPTA